MVVSTGLQDSQINKMNPEILYKKKSTAHYVRAQSRKEESLLISDSAAAILSAGLSGLPAPKSSSSSMFRGSFLATTVAVLLTATMLTSLLTVTWPDPTSR